MLKGRKTEIKPKPRHSFLSTTFSIFINGVLKFMCVFACSLTADTANLSSELSKFKHIKSILKVMTLVMPWLTDIFHLKPKPIAICVLLCKLILKTFFFKFYIRASTTFSIFIAFYVILHTCIGIHVNYIKCESHAWPYPPCINCLLIYKILYPHLAVTLRILSMFLYD